MISERRRHPRHFLNQEAFAALGSEYSRVGKILNISLGGLAFEYIVFQEIDGDNSTVEIFLTSGEIYLNQVPCRVVSDQGIIVNHDRVRNLKRLSTRVCRIQFTSLSGTQKDEIEQFIDTYAGDA